MLHIFKTPYKYTKKKIQNLKKFKNLKIGKIKKYISGKNMKNVHKFVKDWLGRIKISKVKPLTIQFLLMKALLTRKIQFGKKNSKLNV
jgi:hypothetical protein